MESCGDVAELPEEEEEEEEEAKLEGEGKEWKAAEDVGRCRYSSLLEARMLFRIDQGQQGCTALG